MIGLISASSLEEPCIFLPCTNQPLPVRAPVTWSSALNRLREKMNQHGGFTESHGYRTYNNPNVPYGAFFFRLNPRV